MLCVEWGNPVTTAGALTLFHPECARLNLGPVSIPHHKTLQRLGPLWYSSAANER